MGPAASSPSPNCTAPAHIASTLLVCYDTILGSEGEWCRGEVQGESSQFSGGRENKT